MATLADSLDGQEATPKSLRGLRAHMRKCTREPGYAPLFRARSGRRVSYHVLYYHWQQLCCTAGLLDAQGKPRYSLHQLRHTRGTELIESRQPLEIAQRALGHRDLRSTQGYAEINDIRLRAALENRSQR